MSGPRQGEQVSAEMWSWLKEHTIPALTFAGLVLYGITRLSYSSFYEAFGMQPEEVGLGYATVLTIAWPGLLTLLVVWGLTLLVMLVAIFVLGWAWRRLRRKSSESGPEWEMYASILVGVIGLFFFSELPDDAASKARAVKEGEALPLGTGFLDADLLRNPLGLRADPVQLVWLDKDPSSRLGLRPGGTVTYLGRTSDTIVVFDVDQGRTLRIPASLVVLASREESAQTG